MSGDLPSHVVLLGPQRPFQTVDEVVASLEPRGRAVAINAGWQEREGDDQLLRKAMGRRSLNLSLYRRAESVWERDPELAGAHRALQRRLRDLRKAYNVRLSALMDAWFGLGRLEGDHRVLEGQREEAFQAVRDLDRAHVHRVRELRQEFIRDMDPCNRDAVARERDDLASILADADVVGIAGGHVAVLLNRLRLFGLRDWLGGKRIVAWAAGAMVLSETIVLFHDSPPWGPGHPEAFEDGLHVLSNLVVLPDGSHRLRLDDPDRTGRLARRFAPADCVVVDSGARVDWRPGGWEAAGARKLTPEGHVQDLGRVA